jgi:hypothetical protein
MEGQNLNAATSTLRIQCHPKFSASRRRLGKIDEHDPYRMACECIEHLYCCACCMTLVACKLKLANDECSQLLITLKKKNMWTTSADVHAFNTPVAARVFELTGVGCHIQLRHLLAYHIISMRFLDFQI